MILLRRQQDHRSLSTVSVWVALLPLGESVLPVVILEDGKVRDAVHAKIYHNGIGILLGEVTKLAEHLCHSLATRGLRLVKLHRPGVVWILVVFLLGIFHVGVGGFIILIIPIVTAALWWITITTSWQ